MRFSDTFIGLALLCFAAIVVGYASTFPDIPGQPYGPGLFPILIGIGMGVCGLILAVKGWGQHRFRAIFTGSEWLHSAHYLGAFVLSIAAVIFYIVAANTLGFLITSFILLSIMFLWLRRRILSSLCIAAGVTAVTYIIFFYLLSVPLPMGILRPLME